MEVEKWSRHFRSMAEGKNRSNHKEHWIFEEIPQEGSGSKEPEIELLTPLFQNIAIARSVQKEKNYKLAQSHQNRRKLAKKKTSKTTKNFSIRPRGKPAY